MSDYHAPIYQIIEASERVESLNGSTLFSFSAGDFLIGFNPLLLEKLTGLRLANTKAAFTHLARLAFDPVGDYVSGPDGIIIFRGAVGHPTNSA